MRYELIREIFNNCSRNQMRDVFVSEVETDDPAGYLRNMLVGTEIQTTELHPGGNDVIFDVVTDGLHQRFSFTED